MEFKSENHIHAAYMDMLNKGQHYVETMDGPLSIDEWRSREIKRFIARKTPEA